LLNRQTADQRRERSFAQPIEPLHNQQRCIFRKIQKAGFSDDSYFPEVRRTRKRAGLPGTCRGDDRTAAR
jgi:hypothetical protein